MSMNDRIQREKLEKENLELRARITELEAQKELAGFERAGELKSSAAVIQELTARAEAAEELHRGLVEALAMTVANHVRKLPKPEREQP